MKRTMILSMAAAAMMASPAAFAGHNEDGDMDGKKHHKGHMMKKMDTNSDGAISRDEFMAAHEKKFDQMDANGDGSVTEDEMKAAWEEKKEKWKDGKYEKRKKMDEMTDETKDDM